MLSTLTGTRKQEKMHKLLISTVWHYYRQYRHENRWRDIRNHTLATVSGYLDNVDNTPPSYETNTIGSRTFHDFIFPKKKFESLSKKPCHQENLNFTDEFFPTSMNKINKCYTDYSRK